MRKLIALLFLLFIGLTSLCLFAVALVIYLVTVMFDPRLILLHRFTCLWAYLYVFVMPAWKVSFRGREKIRPERTYVVISNHQSLLDILVIFGLFFHFKWVSKAEIFRVPLIGWNMYLNRYVRLKRGDKESIREMMQAAEKHLLAGSSVTLFPEGTRSRDGRLKEFRPGAFILARKLGLPILPIVVNGTTHALPKHSLEFHGYHSIQVAVLDPIEPEQVSALSESELAASARLQMAQALAAMQGCDSDRVLAPAAEDSATARQTDTSGRA